MVNSLSRNKSRKICGDLRGKSPWLVDSLGRKQVKKLIVVTLFLSSVSFAKDLQSCGVVAVEQVITGPRHGALLNISSNSCGNSGYVCLDIEGEYASKEAGQAAYSFALASKMAGLNVSITTDLDFKPTSCGGGYPVVEDIRTQ
jgi:hypothetical protein